MKKTDQLSPNKVEEVGKSHTPSPPHMYQAFLLRLWHEEGSSMVRATLEDAQSGQRMGFANLQHLFAFLERVTNHQPDKE